ncbi:Ig-like domain (group 3) [Nakamurella panacisegetis]|uniref:alpha-L-rhamnosidase n=1 Tax=Nakamurella panacisegetis TaxID=1090615 RepID=A0A1H0LRR4_9ACTN|nr:family 78 glycoside hydrolase catalytic domain [Nakamurella panacisegetis]SDO70912.1 Ig-like domain (group 3) [Nakamurella panacisegetis]
MPTLLRRPAHRSRAISLGAVVILAAGLLIGNAGTAAAATAQEVSTALTVSDLHVNDATVPLGVDADHIGFSWHLHTDVRAVVQNSYRVEVASTAADLAGGTSLVWDSGEVASGVMSDISYAGPALASDTRYYWRVLSATDHAGSAWSAPSSFLTGLLTDAATDAQWVGSPTKVIGADWSDYSVDTDLRIVAETATIYFRANQATNSYMWQLAVDGDHLDFKPHLRVNGGYTVLDQIAIPTTLVPTSTLHQAHHLKISAVGSVITTWLDGTQIDQRADTTYKSGGIGFRTTASETAVFSNMKVVAIPDGSVLLDQSLIENPFSGGSPGPDGLTVTNASPMLVADGSDAWADYRVDITFQIVAQAATVYLHSSATGSDSYMWQFNDFDGNGQLLFKPHLRVGGGYEQLAAVPIPTSIVPIADVDKPHKLSVELLGDHITTWIDGQKIDERDLANHPAGGIGFRQTDTETAIFSALSVTQLPDEKLLAHSDLTVTDQPVFDGGTYVADGLQIHDADVMLAQHQDRTPLVRKDFTLDQPSDHIKQATLYSTAEGNYGARLNGNWVNDDRLSPGSSDYRDRIYYQSSDVASQLRTGPNTIGAQLAPGWYAGNVAWFGPNQFGNSPAFWAQLMITYDDGTTQQIKTDSTWSSGHGSLVQADIINGETDDVRADPTGWDQPGFDADTWKPVATSAADPKVLVAQIGPTIRPVAQTAPVSRREVRPGIWVFDLGQEISGVVRFSATGPSGTTIKLRHAQDVSTDGSLYTGNLLAGSPPFLALQTDTFILAGSGAESFEPRFTYHGFRYFEVTGYPGTPQLADFTGISIGSAVPTNGTLATGNSMLDKLQSNIAWSLQNNLMSIPTDTNARAERLGWAGDATFSSHIATYNYDMEEFYRKWMHDVTYTQAASGLVNNVAPAIPQLTGGGYGGGWGDVIIAIPYASWQRYGDTSIIAENYDAMKKWVLFLEAHSNGTYLLGDDMGPAGDWMNGGENTPGSFTATAYFGWDAMVLADMATAVGKSDDARRFEAIHSSISAAMVDHHIIGSDGTLNPDTQAAYVMSLYADLVPTSLRSAAGAKLVGKIQANGVHLTTGFAATGWALPVLTEIGRSDLAYQLLQQTSYPSWGYMIGKGATTIWERWDYILPSDGAFNPNVLGSSADHAVFGAVGDWMYENIGGIVSDPEQPGYQKFSIVPRPGGSITTGAGTVDSRYGKISSSWRVDPTDGGVDLDATIPTGSVATVSIPVPAGDVVREGGTLAADADGVTFVKNVGGRAVFTVGSGTYRFTTGPASVASPPVVTLATTPGTPNGTNGWYTTPVTLTATATDASDPQPVVQAQIDGADWAQLSTPLPFTTDGTHTASVRARNAAGLISAPVGWTAKIDWTAPVSNVTFDAPSRTLTFAADDNTSGVAKVQYELPGGGWVAADGPIPVGATAMTVSYRAVDNAGNIEAAHQISVPRAGVTLLGSSTVASLGRSSVAVGGTVPLNVKVGGAGATPTGTVRVTSAGVQVGQATLVGGRATVSVRGSAFRPGPHTLKVAYSGNATYAESADTLALTVTKAASTTKITLSAAKVAYGSTNKVTVKVTATGVGPTGTVTIKDGRTTVGTGRLAAGTAVITLPIHVAVGTHTLTATYIGDASVNTSTASTRLVVVKAATTVKGKFTPARITTTTKATVAITATSKPSGTTAVGVVTVRVTAGGRTVTTTTVRLNQGKATATLPHLAAGTYTVTLAYRGSTLLAASTWKATVKVLR